MNEDLVMNALSRMIDLDKRLGNYCGHFSSTKGVTLKTARGAFFVSISFISQILYHPESLTQEKLNQELQLNR